MRPERPQNKKTSTNVTGSHEDGTTAVLCMAGSTVASFSALTDRCNSQLLMACGSERVREGEIQQSGRVTAREKGSDGKRERGGKGEETGTEKVFRVTG